MVTDRIPVREPLRSQFLASDRLGALEMPRDERLRLPSRSIELAMDAEQPAAVRQACAEFLTAAAGFYGVSTPKVRVLAARPIRVRESGWATELFGDYNPDTAVIRIWLRTAVRKQITSYGTFLSTLCHEFCHHLDFVSLGFLGSPHTRGFYERAAVMYHHARGTPQKRLFWVRMPGERWRIDWSRTNRSA